MPDLQSNDVLFYTGTNSARLIGDKFLMQTTAALWLGARADGRTITHWIEDADPGDVTINQNWGSRCNALAPLVRQARAIAARQKRANLPNDWGDAIQICATACGLSRRAAGNWLSELLQSAAALRDLIVPVFRNAKPSRLILSSGGYWTTAAIAAAARDCGVASVEVQHGVVQKTMGPQFLLSSSRPNTLCDVFCAYCRFEIDDDASFDQQRLVVAKPGTLATAKDENLPQGLKRAMAEQSEAFVAYLSRCEAQSHILISHQDFDDLSWLENVVRAVGQNAHFWVRLRHGGRRSSLRCAALDFPNVHVRPATGAPLSVLLPHMNLHLTQYSATALEASCLGVPTIAFHEAAEKNYGAQRTDLISICTLEDLAETVCAKLEAETFQAAPLRARSNRECWNIVDAAMARIPFSQEIAAP